MCVDFGNCSCSCPESPKPNSHHVSDSCSVTRTWDCKCEAEQCLEGKTCDCGCNGLCYYDCDDGFEWDSISETCVKKTEPEPDPEPEDEPEPEGDEEFVAGGTLKAEDIDDEKGLHLIPPQVG